MVNADGEALEDSVPDDEDTRLNQFLHAIDFTRAEREVLAIKSVVSFCNVGGVVTYRGRVIDNGRELPPIRFTREEAVAANPDNAKPLSDFILKFLSSTPGPRVGNRSDGKVYTGGGNTSLGKDLAWASARRRAEQRLAADQSETATSSALLARLHDAMPACGERGARKTRGATASEVAEVDALVGELHRKMGFKDMEEGLGTKEHTPAVQNPVIDFSTTTPPPLRETTGSDAASAAMATATGSKPACMSAVAVKPTGGSRGTKSRGGYGKKSKRKAQKGSNERAGSSPQVMYGTKVPRNMRDMVEFDQEMDDNHTLDRVMKGQRWRKSLRKQVAEFDEFRCFRVVDDDVTARELQEEGYQYLPTHWLATVKQDGTLKLRYVAGGDRITSTAQSFCSMVNMRYSRLMWLIQKANGQRLWTADVKNGYLHADNLEKVYVTLGPEFGPEREGKIAIVDKALYGLPSAGHAFGRFMHAIMTSLGWTPSDADQDIWYRPSKDSLKRDYVSFFVDDATIVSDHPEEIVKELEQYVTLSSAGEPTRYLGADVSVNEEGYTEFNMVSYLKEAVEIVRGTPYGNLAFRRFTKARESWNPMPTDATPETFASEPNATFLGKLEIRLYQRFIGMLSWIRILGRFDIAQAVAELSRYQIAPTHKHMELAAGVFGYLARTTSYSLLMDPAPLVPEGGSYNEQPEFHQDRQELLKQYQSAGEFRSPRDPLPMGEELQISVFCDASHGDDKEDRRSTTGIVVMVGSTVVQVISKRQGVIPASASYTSELHAAKQAVELIQGWRVTLRALGLPVTKPSWLFIDNKGVQLTATNLKAACKVKHTAIGYHILRASVAAGIVAVKWVASADNCADLCTKALGGTLFHRHASAIMKTSHAPDPAAFERLRSTDGGSSKRKAAGDEAPVGSVPVAELRAARVNCIWSSTTRASDADSPKGSVRITL